MVQVLTCLHLKLNPNKYKYWDSNLFAKLAFSDYF